MNNLIINMTESELSSKLDEAKRILFSYFEKNRTNISYSCFTRLHLIQMLDEAVCRGLDAMAMVQMLEVKIEQLQKLMQGWDKTEDAERGDEKNT